MTSTLPFIRRPWALRKEVPVALIQYAQPAPPSPPAQGGGIFRSGCVSWPFGFGTDVLVSGVVALPGFFASGFPAGKGTNVPPFFSAMGAPLLAA